VPLNLPDRASNEYLKKLAKERLILLRRESPSVKLADAQLAIAREYGFSSWRLLKAEVDRRREPRFAAFVEACRAGDVASLERLLAADPSLVHERVASGSTGLHLAASHPDAVQLLLAHGADPNARDEGDNATPLHLAAAKGNLVCVRLLLDAGADVHGSGDVHEGDVIGWAAGHGNQAVIALLLERGARHHIFSAMALGDHSLVERLVEDDPGCLSRRRSRFESGHTSLHAAFAPPDGLGFLMGQPNYAMLQHLIDLGADLEARDAHGRTPLGLARLRGDDEAIRLLTAAGSRDTEPSPPDQAAFRTGMRATASSVKHASPMFFVADVRTTVGWYRDIGFTIEDQYEDDGELKFAHLKFGSGDFTLSPGGSPGPRDVRLWFFTDRVTELYELLKTQAIPFEEDLYTPFYGGRQFSIRDPNGLNLIFWQPEWLVPSSTPPTSA